MNETGNTGYISAETVPPVSISAQLIARAVKVGPVSPEGKRLYMLRAQLENGVSPVRTIAEIAQIQRDGGAYVHEHHGAGR